MTEWGGTANNYGFFGGKKTQSFYFDKNVLKLDGGDGCIIL